MGGDYAGSGRRLGREWAETRQRVGRDKIMRVAYRVWHGQHTVD